MLFKNILLYLCKQTIKIIIMTNPFNTSVPNVKINDKTTVNVLLDVMVRIKRIQADNVLSIDTQYELSNLRTFISSYRFHVINKIKQENRDRLIRNQ